MVSREVFIEQSEEVFAHICLDVKAEWWVEPDFGSGASSSSSPRGRCEGKPLLMAAIFKSFIVVRCCLPELELIAGSFRYSLTDHFGDLFDNVRWMVGLGMDVLGVTVRFFVRVISHPNLRMPSTEGHSLALRLPSLRDCLPMNHALQFADRRD